MKGSDFLFTTFIPQGYLIDFCDHTDSYQHYFCGPHETKGAFCPNCDKPLLRILNIDLTDPRLLLTKVRFSMLPLFFCWTCYLSIERFYYRVTSDGIEILSYGKGRFEQESSYGIPYSDYPLFFDGTDIILTPLTEEHQNFNSFCNEFQHDPHNPEKKEQFNEFVKNNEEFYAIYHQIGGEPLFPVQIWETWYMKCPVCTREMPFFASIGDYCLDPRGFTSSTVHLVYVYCKHCNVVGAFAQSD